mmetsp:Transcript_14308/g.40858  ORF Transcript_14308/g.40858 Transcript_14308/m.40858 type:complete len:212 (-) Transcript_14308:411-1046(-)
MKFLRSWRSSFLCWRSSARSWASFSLSSSFSFSSSARRFSVTVCTCLIDVISNTMGFFFVIPAAPAPRPGILGLVGLRKRLASEPGIAGRFLGLLGPFGSDDAGNTPTPDPLSVGSAPDKPIEAPDPFPCTFPPSLGRARSRTVKCECDRRRSSFSASFLYCSAPICFRTSSLRYFSANGLCSEGSIASASASTSSMLDLTLGSLSSTRSV